MNTKTKRSKAQLPGWRDTACLSKEQWTVETENKSGDCTRASTRYIWECAANDVYGVCVPATTLIQCARWKSYRVLVT